LTSSSTIFIESVLKMINHFLLVQQEQEKFLDYELAKRKYEASKDLITLRHSNETVKQFHSILSVLMVTIASLAIM
jgi:hypothetical protein